MPTTTIESEVEDSSLKMLRNLDYNIISDSINS